ncbi:hypothetical protein L7F22_012494 [Adiantum nelumboides]|nr:hypothetical protein [Adiantum nelumboides]
MVISNKASPGPGTYFPRTTNNGSPAFTFGKRASRGGSGGTPGPADYFPSPNVHSPSFSMGKKAPPPFDEGTPGPGSYFVLTHPLSNSHSPAFTLATRPFAAAASPVRRFDDASPGPGSYETAASSIPGPKFTIRTRKPVVIKEPLPGPGSYFVDHSQSACPSPLCHHHRPQDL